MKFPLVTRTDGGGKLVENCRIALLRCVQSAKEDELLLQQTHKEKKKQVKKARIETSCV
jgi:hypothetical protein